jgi:hypothetical protein
MTAIMSEPYRPGYAGGMAKSGGSRGRPGRRRPNNTATRKTATQATPAPPVTEPMPRVFVLGVVPGATPGRWIDAWRERMPATVLELQPIAFATQRAQLLDGGIDAALVRLPLDRGGLHVITLYDERSVVVSSAESHLTAAEELDLADLAGEIVIVPQDDVLGLEIPGAVAASFAPPEDTAQAIATVAAGIGVVVVPMSLARLHRRKDTDYRPLRDAPVSTVALAWPIERTTPAVEAFVGIVRGRTPNSSRA